MIINCWIQVDNKTISSYIFSRGRQNPHVYLVGVFSTDSSCVTLYIGRRLRQTPPSLPRHLS
ncbi:MAG: hypothetical protein LUD00_11945 [Prevotellaceae bacterium]|nr:hypothetical protein [Prevotellaceae bacterium]